MFAPLKKILKQNMLCKSLLCELVANWCKLVCKSMPPARVGPTGVTQYILSVTARALWCKHLKWEWDLVELVLPGHQPKDVTTHRWSQLPFYPLHLHLVSRVNCNTKGNIWCWNCDFVMQVSCAAVTVGCEIYSFYQEIYIISTSL